MKVYNRISKNVEYYKKKKNITCVTCYFPNKFYDVEYLVDFNATTAAWQSLFKLSQ